MKYLSIATAVASLANSVCAAVAGEWGFALGLFAGFAAWVIVASHD